RREPGETADSVAAGAAAAEPGPEADQQTAQDEQRPGSCDLRQRAEAETVRHEGADKKTAQEQHPPRARYGFRREQPGGDAADARNAAVGDEKQCGRSTD